ncbi:class C sortase [uncultured Corynebacterium sp.]|uniref:class C sortase n=1 Tax=uncultured Corynebacterium sp. TaxID=159447 RepID=UPI0025D46C0B|nr:class C sortase [uncultured Corynebacterium sp.]
MGRHSNSGAVKTDGRGRGAGNGGVAKQKGKRNLKGILVPLLLILAGLSVLLYPVVATQWNYMKQMRAAEAYSQLEREEDPQRLRERFDAAVRYNAERGPASILDPWNNDIGGDDPAYRAYLDQLNISETMGRIIVPAAGADLPIYHGTSHDVLQKGVGHLYGTDLPVGGESTHSVLTGHTGLSNATLFDNLDDVEKGDPIYLAVSGEKLKYEVHDIQVVLPHETEGLATRPGEDLVTLITCTPYGINSHRLLVTGHRVPMDPEDEGVFDDNGLNWQWWMWAILAAAVAAVIFLIFWLRKMLRRQPVDAAETAKSD